MSVPPELIESVRRAGSILIVTHSPMDGDGLGSGLALMRGLRASGKQCRFATEARVPRVYAFLPDYDQIWRIDSGEPLPECDLILGLDAGEGDRLGRAFSERGKDTVLANIDHHVSNSGFGDVNWVDPEAAATGEQAFLLLQALGAPIDAGSALCLLVALATDTGRFCYSNTTPRTLETAAALVRLGAEPDLLQRHVYGAVPKRVLRLQARAIDDIEFHAGGALAMLLVPPGMGDDLGVAEEDIKDLVDIVIGVKGVVVGVLVRGLPDGTAKVSLRSKSDASDVARFAAQHGGGGHVRAAGFTSPEPPEETARRIRPALEKLAVAGTG